MDVIFELIDLYNNLASKKSQFLQSLFYWHMNNLCYNVQKTLAFTG